MTDTNRPKPRPVPLRAPQVGPQDGSGESPAAGTVAAATREADQRATAAALALVKVDSRLDLDEKQAAQALASTAVAESNLAVAAELRALRLMLAQQLPALRSSR